MDYIKIFPLNSVVYHEKLEAMFNPSELSYGVENIFNNKQFCGTQISDLILNLEFDSTTDHVDIRERHYDSHLNREINGTNEFEKLAYPTGFGLKSMSPPICKVTFGTYHYIGLVKSVQTTCTAFEGSIPVRAKVTISFQPFLDEQKLKFFLGIEACRKSHVVQKKDRLDKLAFSYYKDPSSWPKIANANKIDPLCFPSNYVNKTIIIPD